MDEKTVERVARAMMRRAYEELGEPTTVLDHTIPISRMTLCGVDMRVLAAVAVGEIAAMMVETGEDRFVSLEPPVLGKTYWPGD